MRVTFNSQYRDAAEGIETATRRLIEFQRQVASNKRMGKISDDPEAASQAIGERAELAQIGQYTRAADSVASRLTVTDTVLSDVIEKLSSAQSLAQGVRGSEASPAQRDAAVQQLRGLRSALLDDMNTSFHGTYVFAGTDATTRPYTLAGNGSVNPYAGNNSSMQVDVGDDRAVAVAFDGEAITLGGEPQDMFASIDDLITAISAGDSDAITTGMATLERAFTRATAAQTRLGSDMQVIDSQKLRLQQMRLSGTERLSKLEDVNMAESISGMTQADAAYRAALGAANASTRPSLLDYLK